MGSNIQDKQNRKIGDISPYNSKFQMINSFLNFIYSSINEQHQLLITVIFAGGTMEYLTVYILGFCNTWIFQHIVLLF